MFAGLTRRTRGEGRKTRGRRSQRAGDTRLTERSPASRLVGLATPLSAHRSVGIPHLPRARINTCPHTDTGDAEEAVARPAVHSTQAQSARSRQLQRWSAKRGTTRGGSRSTASLHWLRVARALSLFYTGRHEDTTGRVTQQGEHMRTQQGE